MTVYKNNVHILYIWLWKKCSEIYFVLIQYINNIFYQWNNTVLQIGKRKHDPRSWHTGFMEKIGK